MQAKGDPCRLPIPGARHGALPLALPVGMSVALVAVRLSRIKRVADLFARGVAVSGTVTDLIIAKDRGRLVF